MENKYKDILEEKDNQLKNIVSEILIDKKLEMNKYIHLLEK